MYGLAQTGFSFLDPGLLTTFVERWHGETNTFHMPNGQMTVTLDDMCCLLCLPIQGQLLDHASITTKAEDRVDNYLWGTVALAFLYRELRNAAWVYNHFEDIGGTKSKCYVEEMSSACKYELTKGQTNQLAMRKMMGWLLPHDTTWTPYEDHRDVWSFEDIALYSGWIRCGPIRVRYLPERVLRHFGYIETISRHPHAAANPLTTMA
ncbi:protein MAIN-LIKE 2-like [Trifolium pratense]|uniref:protein MAIN-LIKE 2-like n=1 Tax=Trifolium pratense TaxID=57577 RepID=UPI001E691248|nr:protein MAIN-LIKE 2-like [Trifolium pratense]